MAQRINVILPEATVLTIDRLARPGQRSRFIDRAVQHYVATASAEALQGRLKQAALRDHDLDLEIAGDWFAVDQEQWQKLDEQERRPATGGRKEAKFTSRHSTRQSGTRSKKPGLP
jgi:CopG family transcriptional regulator/antitoxin EndoAI